MRKHHRVGLGRRTVVAMLIASATVACRDGEDRRASKSASSPERMYELASTANGFVAGDATAADPVYIFFDPQCPVCATLWATVKQVLGQVKLVWIPVGLLRPASAPQGAAILSSADPVAAMNEHEASIRNGAGGISAFGSSERAKAQVADNTALFKAAGQRLVPLIVYRNRKTGRHGVFAGSPTTEGFADLVGL